MAVRTRGRGRVVTGVTQADVITTVDGRRVETADELVGYLRGLSVGDEVELTVLRGSETLHLTVTLGARSL